MCMIDLRQDGNRSQEKEQWASFVAFLEDDVNKVVNFYLDQETKINVELRRLLPRYRAYKNKRSTSTDGASIVREYYGVGERLLKLVTFADLNVVAIRKILKKHDKQVNELPALTSFFLDGFDKSYPRIALNKTLAGQQRLAKKIESIEIIIDDVRSGVHYPSPSKTKAESELSNKSLRIKLREAQVAFQQSCKDLTRARFKSACDSGAGVQVERGLKAASGAAVEGGDASSMDFAFNFFAIILYQINYYVTLPTTCLYPVILRRPLYTGFLIFAGVPIGAAIARAVAQRHRSYYTCLGPVSRCALASMGNLVYALGVVFDVLVPGLGIFVAFVGRFMIGCSGFSESSAFKSAMRWRVLDALRDGGVKSVSDEDDKDFKVRLCFAVTRTLSGAIGLAIGMIPAALLLEQSESSAVETTGGENASGRAWWALCFSNVGVSSLFMMVSWLILFALSIASASMSPSSSDEDGDEGTADLFDVSVDNDDDDDEIENRIEDSGIDHKMHDDVKNEPLSGELTPLVGTFMRTPDLSWRTRIDERTHDRASFLTRENKTSRLFGIPRRSLLFLTLTVWLEVVKEILVIIFPLVSFYALEWAPSSVAWVLCACGFVVLLSYFFSGWISGLYVSSFGTSNTCTSATVLVLLMMIQVAMLIHVVYEMHVVEHFESYAVFVIPILSTATFASVSNALCLCSYTHDAPAGLRKSSIRTISSLVAAIVVVGSAFLAALDPRTRTRSSVAMEAADEAMVFVLVSQGVLSLLTFALLVVY